MKKDSQVSAIPQSAARPENPGFTVNIRLSVLLYIAVVWSYFFQATARPFALPPMMDVVLYSALAIGLFWFYRDHSISFRMTRRDLGVLGLYFASFVLLNIKSLAEPITCDEQAHAQDSFIFLHLLKAWMANGTVDPNGRLSTMPLNEMSYYFSAAVLIMVAIGVFIGVKIGEHRRPAIFYLYLSIVTLGIGAFFSIIPVELSPHAPMRILPVFASSLFLGLDDYALRLPGIACMAVISFAMYRIILRKLPDARVLAFIAGFSLMMIPTVYHVSAILEPAIWAFAAWVFCFLFIYLSLETGSLSYTIAAGVAVAVGSVMRQNVIVLWPIVGLLFILNKHIRKPFIMNGLRICLPGIIAIPYFIAIKQIGHSLTEGGGVDALSEALTGGIALDFILKHSGVFWIVAAVIGTIYTLIATRTLVKYFYLSIFPALVLYFSIQRFVWGVGRYQAEYIAPLVALTIFLVVLELPARFRSALAAILIFLGAYSVHANVTMCQDVQFGGADCGKPSRGFPYGSWPSRRLTTEKYFPYKQALDWLLRQEIGGNFIVVGGVGTHSEGMMAPRGYSFSDIRKFDDNMKKFDEFIRKPEQVNLDKFMGFLMDNRINVFLLQYGDKVEMQHRSMHFSDRAHGLDNMNALFYQMAFYYRDHFGKNAPFIYQQTFFGDMGGAIDVYSATALRYGPYPVDMSQDKKARDPKRQEAQQE